MKSSHETNEESTLFQDNKSLGLNIEKQYIAIDLKSFYASVECVERGLDPLTTNLVVADESRTEKTICLAVSPSLKAHGIGGRARLFEVVQRVKEVNKAHPREKLTYLVARPRMALYMDYSTRIYNIYLRFVAKEDIHVYSVDEVMIDVTSYLETYRMTARQLAAQMIRAVMKETGITATAGIGTNLYLCKVAMDIVAKHVEADEDGLRIAELDEMSYRRLLWDHKPITDFWRVGKGYAKKLEAYGMYTMGDVARCSIGKENDFLNEELLYKLFGINAELLIDHAWGYEPVTMQEIKSYRPSVNSISQGQVLSEPYSFEKARIIVQEMTELLVLDLVDKHLVTDQMVLTIGYDIENLKDAKKKNAYKGEITTDHYGRKVPKHAHGTTNLDRQCSSTMQIMEHVLALYDSIVDPSLTVRRINVVANRVVSEEEAVKNAEQQFEQLDLFTDYEKRKEQKEKENEMLEKEKRLQQAMLSVKKRYGKNAILRGTNYQDGATMRQRNEQIGGHKA